MLLVNDKDGNLDELLEEAIKICARYDAVSASLIQRKLAIGYARAARILDQLEYAGIVGPANGSKPRKLLIRNNKALSQKDTKRDTRRYLWVNAQLITNLLEAHGIFAKLVRITIQKEHILFLFDFAVGTKIDEILKLDKEIAAILSSPTGKVEMGAPFKGTSLLFIYLPIKKKMKEETYEAIDIDIKKIKPDASFLFRAKLREFLLGLAGFLDELAYKI